MNNVRVLKTINGSTIFNNRLSWFIYTPTENLRIAKKIPTFQTSNPKSQYRTQYRKTPLKSTLLPIQHPNFNPQFKPLSSYINTKIPRKIHTFTDYQLFIKNHLNNIKIHTYLQFKKENIKHRNKNNSQQIFKIKRR